MKQLRRCLCVIMCLVLLCGLVSGAENANDVEPLRDRMQEFIAENGLNSGNFALSYYNPTSGESYHFNETSFFPAGELWRLPLHMYYYEQESLGAYDPPPEDPTFVYTVAGLTLDECHYYSIILASEEVAEKMRENIGTYDQYKLTVNEAFGHVPEEELPEEFCTDNVYSTLFWINTLRAVSDQPELYQEMTRNFNMVQTVDGFASYGKDYPMVHIRGEEGGFVCDAGEISAPETYLLACCVSEEAGGDMILGRVNALICEYVEEGVGIEQDVDSEAFVRGDAAMEVVSAGNDKGEAFLWIGAALGGAAILGAIIGFVFWLVRRKQDDYYY